LEKHVARLKKDNIRTIAKLDVFADHQLAEAFPELSVMDRSLIHLGKTPMVFTGPIPGDSRVWDYNIALSKELARMGFDEIQFDYVRFPSDGDLSSSATRTRCPVFPNRTASSPFSKRRTMN
jgi:hypothetical protein